MASINSFRQILPYFPAQLQSALAKLPDHTAHSIQEIRLRIGRNLHVVMRGEEFCLATDGTLQPEPCKGYPIDRLTLDTLFRNACAHSLHSCHHAIQQGFLTIAGGCRVGLCGTAVMQNGTLDSIRAISSLNLRIAAQQIGCADELRQRLGDHPNGLLLVGAPASGKTTLLRDLARSYGMQHRVCILDERGEIAAVQNGMPQFELGTQTDVLDGYPKAAAVEIAVRTLSPQLLICDELGNGDEVDALLQSLNAGVEILASAHGDSLSRIKARPQIARLLQAGVFQHLVLLGTGLRCGQVLAWERVQRS